MPSVKAFIAHDNRSQIASMVPAWMSAFRITVKTNRDFTVEDPNLQCKLLTDMQKRPSTLFVGAPSPCMPIAIVFVVSTYLEIDSKTGVPRMPAQNLPISFFSPRTKVLNLFASCFKMLSNVSIGHMMGCDCRAPSFPGISM
eukprot:3022521-Pyramimonas_sp.AAC.1